MSTPVAQSAVPVYAGFWRRGAAALLDNLVLALPSYAINMLFAQSAFLAFLLQVALGCAYYSLMHSSASQATLGKKAMGIKVADLAGQRITPLRGVGRYFAVWVSMIPIMLGFLLAAFTERKQALHDMIAGTVVVNARAAPEEIPAGSGTMPLTAGVWAAIVVLVIFPMGGIVAAIAIPGYADYVKRQKAPEIKSETLDLMRFRV